MFIARVFYAIDNRLFSWLNKCKCKNSKSVTDTNLDLISFGSIISEIQMGLFHRDLPKWFIKLTKDNEEVGEKYKKDDGERKKQKQSKQI